ncbi:MAG: hypothetical protein ACOCV1_07575 [Bacillota bacterium]
MKTDYINDLTKALDSEIKTLKKGTSGKSVTIFNGKFQRQISNLYVYTFRLENFLSVIDDTPAEIIINNKNYKGQIISVSGLEIDIAIEEKLGNLISKAVINTNLWFLLERLKDKLENNKNNQKKFRKSDELFNLNFKKQNSTSIEPQYTNLDITPNESQKKPSIIH